MPSPCEIELMDFLKLKPLCLPCQCQTICLLGFQLYLQPWQAYCFIEIMQIGQGKTALLKDFILLNSMQTDVRVGGSLTDKLLQIFSKLSIRTRLWWRQSAEQEEVINVLIHRSCRQHLGHWSPDGPNRTGKQALAFRVE